MPAFSRGCNGELQPCPDHLPVNLPPQRPAYQPHHLRASTHAHPSCPQSAAAWPRRWPGGCPAGGRSPSLPAWPAWATLGCGASSLRAPRGCSTRPGRCGEGSRRKWYEVLERGLVLDRTCHALQQRLWVVLICPVCAPCPLACRGRPPRRWPRSPWPTAAARLSTRWLTPRPCWATPRHVWVGWKMVGREDAAGALPPAAARFMHTDACRAAPPYPLSSAVCLLLLPHSAACETCWPPAACAAAWCCSRQPGLQLEPATLALCCWPTA